MPLVQAQLGAAIAARPFVPSKAPKALSLEDKDGERQDGNVDNVLGLKGEEDMGKEEACNPGNADGLEGEDMKDTKTCGLSGTDGHEDAEVEEEKICDADVKESIGREEDLEEEKAYSSSATELHEDAEVEEEEACDVDVKESVEREEDLEEGKAYSGSATERHEDADLEEEEACGRSGTEDLEDEEGMEEENACGVSGIESIEDEEAMEREKAVDDSSTADLEDEVGEEDEEMAMERALVAQKAKKRALPWQVNTRRRYTTAYQNSPARAGPISRCRTEFASTGMQGCTLHDATVCVSLFLGRDVEAFLQQCSA
jgi:hypothetical protein